MKDGGLPPGSLTVRSIWTLVTMNSRVLFEKISILVPVGVALLGLRAGQSIDWELPSGGKHRYRVIAVPYQPETASENHAG